MSVTTLSDVDHGVYAIRTEHSAYVVDMNERMLVRSPVEEGANDLRGDRDEVSLKQILTCEVGLPAVFVVKDLTPGVTTIRRTTRVVGIEVVA